MPWGVRCLLVSYCTHAWCPFQNICTNYDDACMQLLSCPTTQGATALLPHGLLPCRRHGVGLRGGVRETAPVWQRSCAFLNKHIPQHRIPCLLQRAAERCCVPMINSVLPARTNYCLHLCSVHFGCFFHPSPATGVTYRRSIGLLCSRMIQCH